MHARGRRSFAVRGVGRPRAQRFAAVGVLCAAPLLLGVAWPQEHLEIQAGKAPYIDGAGAILGGNTSWGVVLPAPDGDGYRRVCEESYDPNPAGVATASFSLLRADGSVLVGGYLGTFVSRDAGCTLEPVAAPLRGHSTSSVVQAAGRLFVATFDVQSDNGVFVSDDGGETWVASLEPRANVSLFRLAASPDGLRVVATGTMSMVPARPAVFLTEDGGATWSDLSSAYETFDIVTAGSFDEDGETLLLGGTQLQQGQYQGHVLEAAPPYTSPTTIGLFPSQVTHVAARGGARHAVLPLRSEMYTQVDRTLPFVKTHDLDATSPEPPGPTDCIGVMPDGSALFGCARQSINSLGLFLTSQDGAAWTAAIAFHEVGYRVCPVGSVGAAKCASYFETSCRDGADNDFDGATDCDDSDCSPCDGGEGPEDAGVWVDAGAPSERDAGPDGVEDVDIDERPGRSGCQAAPGVSGVAWCCLAALAGRVRARRRPRCVVLVSAPVDDSCHRTHL